MPEDFVIVRNPDPRSGVEVSDRGRLPDEVQQAYRAAHRLADDPSRPPHPWSS